MIAQERRACPRGATRLAAVLLTGIFLARPGSALPPDDPAKPAPHDIQDNSFLIEEAYNQEPGVVQHINQFTRQRGSGDWVYTFTQEYPVGGIRNQLSYTIPLASAGGNRGLGDVALNYRYQLVGDGEAKVAVAPRLSLFLPTGDFRRGLGAGTVTYQVSLPVSTLLSRDWIAHWNAGATWTPSSRNPAGDRANALTENLGASVIFIGSSILDVMLESVYSRAQTVTAPGRTSRQTTWLLSPGVRWAYNFPSGLQIVPGIAVPIGIGPSRGTRQILLYLSFEHPFSAAGTKRPG